MKSLILVLAVKLSLVVAKLTFIDLTHTVGTKTVFWPANPPFKISEVFKWNVEGGIVVGNYFQTAEHTGTHMDAPLHFCQGRKAVHEIPLDRLSGPGVVMDLSTQAAQNSDYEVTLQDVKNWEAKHGLVPEGAIVLVSFGWEKFWPDHEKVFGTDDVQNTSTYHFPGLGIEASKYLAGTRRIRAVGTDTSSADSGQSHTFPVHFNLLCDHDVLILENVASIAKLPVTGSRVFIGALKLENGSGTPVRLYATMDDERATCGAREATPVALTPVLLFSLLLVLKT